MAYEDIHAALYALVDTAALDIHAADSVGRQIVLQRHLDAIRSEVIRFLQEGVFPESTVPLDVLDPVSDYLCDIRDAKISPQKSIVQPSEAEMPPDRRGIFDQYCAQISVADPLQRAALIKIARQYFANRIQDLPYQVLADILEEAGDARTADIRALQEYVATASDTSAHVLEQSFSRTDDGARGCCLAGELTETAASLPYLRELRVENVPATSEGIEGVLHQLRLFPMLSHGALVLDANILPDTRELVASGFFGRLDAGLPFLRIVNADGQLLLDTIQIGPYSPEELYSRIVPDRTIMRNTTQNLQSPSFVDAVNDRLQRQQGVPERCVFVHLSVEDLGFTTGRVSHEDILNRMEALQTLEPCPPETACYLSLCEPTEYTEYGFDPMTTLLPFQWEERNSDRCYFFIRADTDRMLLFHNPVERGSWIHAEDRHMFLFRCSRSS